jgi:hypothetical protein
MVTVVSSTGIEIAAQIEDAIRTIFDEREHLHHAWGDHRIVKEALHRAGVQPTAADATLLASWVAIIGEIRSETDNDGQERILLMR